MEIISVNINELTPDPNNAKDHPTWQVEQIKNSIKQFGNLDPIGIWGDDNLIVEGHGRYLALKELGYSEVECIRLDWLTEEERKAYALVHNKLTMNSGFIPEALDMNLDAIGEIDMSQFGFEIPEEEEPTEIAEDELPEEVETRCKLGDIWRLGDHRLICGDSTDVNVIDRLIDGAKAKLLLTDPPYGIDYGGMLKGKGDGKGGADKNGWKSYDAPTWDIERPDESVFSYIITLAEESIIWGGNYFADILPPKMCWLVWDKGQRDFSLADGELAWTSFDKALRIKTYSRASANREEKVHPTQKPIELLRWCIEDIAERNMESVDTILDLFGGSGSTLIACEQLNRKCYMAELDPHYCDVIIQRWENLTGGKAVRINDAG